MSTKKNRAQSGDIASMEQVMDDTINRLLKQYSSYRTAVIVLACCCFALLIAGMGLYKAEIISADVQNYIFVGSYVIMAALLYIVFTKVRPIKADIREWRAASAEAKERTEKKRKRVKLPSAPESLSRDAKHPPSPEYHRMRKIWWALVILAILIIFAAMYYAHSDGTGDLTVPGILLVVSYVFIFGAGYVEMRHLRPQRKAWQDQCAKKRAAERKAAQKGK